MKFFTTLKNHEIDSIAIGGFDGIHRGHQKLIDNLTKNGVLFVVEKNSSSLTPFDTRCKYTKKGCVFVPFEDIKKLSAEKFVNYLKDLFPNLKKIIVGYDFKFANGRSADANILSGLFDGEVFIVDEVLHNGISVHSSFIKELLKEAKIEEANELLDRNYSIKGVVIKGQGIGKKELFATLNLNVESYLIPKEGVYATYTKCNKKIYKSVSFIGHRVSTDDKFSIETHIIDENLDENIDKVDLSFVCFIRENRKFETLESLKKQINLDIDRARSCLS